MRRIILLVTMSVLFLVMTYLVASGLTQGADQTVSGFFYAARNPGLNTLMEGLTYLGNWESITVICLLLLVYPKTRMAYGVPVSAAALLTTGIKSLVKPLIARPRPELVHHLIDQGGFSYPSGHAITSIAVFLLLIILVRKNLEDRKKANLWTVLLLISGLGIGGSRIYLGVHYPSDVLGGWCGGLAVALAVWVVMDVLEKKGWIGSNIRGES